MAAFAQSCDSSPVLPRPSEKRLKNCVDSLQVQDAAGAAKYWDRDLIGEFPDDALCLVVSKLRLRDAVKTTLLSRRWAHILPSLFEFKFDWVQLFLPGDKKVDAESGFGRKIPCDEFWYKSQISCAQPWKDEFLRGVSRFLQLYQPPHIHSFEISFCLGQDETDDIDGWVRFAVQRGVQKLKLGLCCVKTCCEVLDDVHLTKRKGKYVFCSALLDAAKTSLKDLVLVGCDLELGPKFSGQFCQLKALTLASVTLSEDVVRRLFPCLVMLQHLHLKRCLLCMDFCIASSSRLETLIIACCAGIRKIELPEANLLVFQCSTSSVVTFDLPNYPNLHSLCYSIDKSGSHNVLASLPEAIPGLRDVVVVVWSANIDWVEPLSRKMATFATVRQLWLYFKKHTEFCFSALRAFPSLQSLFLEMICSGDDAEQQRGKVGPGINAPEHLKDIFIHACGASRYTEFAVSLLEHASTVERLTISQMFNCCKRRWLWDDAEKKRALHLLQGVSKNVVVIIQ